MATGTVQRFDPRRGFGFIRPDAPSEVDADGKPKDVFVHQNDIEMDGFRSLQENEKVEYEEEIGDKGPKAVHVRLTSPRAPRAPRAAAPGPRRPSAGPRRGSDNADSRLDSLIQLLADVEVITVDELAQYGIGNFSTQSR